MNTGFVSQDRPVSRPLRELHRIVAADNALFGELTEAWASLLDSDKAYIVKWAKVAAARNEAGDAA